MKLGSSLLVLFSLACASAPPPANNGTAADSTAATATSAERLEPVWAMRACERATFGEPVAMTLDFGGTVFVADASPPRVVSYAEESQKCIEFQPPDDSPAFRPSDVAVRGFFVYAVDEPDRALLRWDASGSWRD